MRLILLWEEEWIPATLVAVRNCRGSKSRHSVLSSYQNEEVATERHVSKPRQSAFWAYYDGDEAGQREKVLIKSLHKKVLSVSSAGNGDPIPWRALPNLIEDSTLIDSTLLASKTQRHENFEHGGQHMPEISPLLTAPSIQQPLNGENPSIGTTSACIEALKVMKSRLWKFGHSSSLQHILKFPMRTRTGKRPRLGDLEPLSSPLLETGIACTEISLTLQTAIFLGENFSGLKFMSRAANLSFGGRCHSDLSLCDFGSGKQLIKAFFGETYSPPTETILRLGNLAVMGVGMVGKTVCGRIVTFVLTSVSYSDSANSECFVTGFLWKDSAVSSSTQLPMDTAIAIIACPCQVVGQRGSRNGGIRLCIDFPGTETGQDVILYWIDSKRNGVVARASWEVDKASVEAGPSMRSFTDVVGNLILDVSFVSVNAIAIDSCVNAREKVLSTSV